MNIAGGMFYGINSGLMAFGLTRHSYHRLMIAYLGAPWALTLAGIDADARTDRRHRRRCSSSSARSPGRSASTCSARVVKVGIARRDRRVGRHRPRAAARLPRRRTSRSSTHTLGAEALSGGSVGAGHARRAGGRRLGVHRLRRLRRGRRRRRATPRATSRARSGSRCSASARLVILNAFAVDARASRTRPTSSPGATSTPSRPRSSRRSARGRRSRSRPSCSAPSSPAGWRRRR